MKEAINLKEIMFSRKLAGGMLLTALLIFTLNPVWGLDGEEILAKMEKTLTAPRDSESTAQMVLANSDGSGQEQRSLKTWMAGEHKRVMKFLSPAGIAGIGLLTLDENELYLYLPAQSKIRRIEGGSKNEEFQGTDFSYSELGSYAYKQDYSARLTAEDETTYTLLLTRKPGADRAYEKLVLVVDKSTYVPQTIDFYEKDVAKKRLTLQEVKIIEGYFIPTRIRMENLVKKHFTEIILSDIKLNQNLEGKDIFSKRFLKQRAH